MKVRKIFSIYILILIGLLTSGCKPEIDSYSPTTDPVSMRVGDTQVFTINATMNDLEYKWLLDGVQQASITKNFSYSPSSADIGSHTLKVTVYNNFGSVSVEWRIGVEMFSMIWDRSYGGSGDDVSTAVQMTSDGGYILAGYSNSTNISGTVNNGDYDFYVIKLDNSGVVQWQNLYGGSSLDKAHGIAQTGDGGYIVAGSSQSVDIPGAINHGGSDFYVLKLSSSGAIQWQGLFGSSVDDFGMALEVTQDGGYAIAGYTSSSLLAYDGSLIKLNSSGAVVFEKTYDTGALEFIYAVKETVNGGGTANGFILTGSKNATSGWVLRTNNSGSILWQKTYGGYPILGCALQGVRQAGDGSFITTGWVQEYDQKGNNKPDALTIKYNSSGTKIWETDSGGISWDAATALEIMPAWSRYILTGKTQSDELPGSTGLPQVGDFDVYIGMLNASGTCLYQERYGNNDFDDSGNAIAGASWDDNGFVIAGQKGGIGSHDVNLLKYNINK